MIDIVPWVRRRVGIVAENKETGTSSRATFWFLPAAWLWLVPSPWAALWLVHTGPAVFPNFSDGDGGWLRPVQAALKVMNLFKIEIKLLNIRQFFLYLKYHIYEWVKFSYIWWEYFVILDSQIYSRPKPSALEIAIVSFAFRTSCKEWKL